MVRPVWRIRVATPTSCKQVFSKSESRNHPTPKRKDWRLIPPRKGAGVPWSPSSLMIPRPSAQDAPISCGPSAAGPRDTATGQGGTQTPTLWGPGVEAAGNGEASSQRR